MSSSSADSYLLHEVASSYSVAPYTYDESTGGFNLSERLHWIDIPNLHRLYEIVSRNFSFNSRNF